MKMFFVFLRVDTFRIESISFIHYSNTTKDDYSFHSSYTGIDTIIMVIQGDFKVQLVEAKTKKPFQEHFKDGRVYVEVEPGAEFFVSVQKVGNSSSPSSGLVMAKPLVDDQGLGWRKSYLARRTDDTPDYFGLFRRNTTGNLATQALQFVRPELDIDKQTVGMGNVQVKIYESRYLGDRKAKRRTAKRKMSRMTANTSPFSTEKVSTRESIRVGMKCVRAKAGTKKFSEELSTRRHEPGCLIDAITLNYCSLPGLLYSGVLPMPSNIYASHKIMKGARDGFDDDTPSKQTTQQPPQKQVKLTKLLEMDNRLLSKTVEFYDLYDLQQNPSSLSRTAVITPEKVAKPQGLP
jgi:hypothetical protein